MVEVPELWRGTLKISAYSYHALSKGKDTARSIRYGGSGNVPVGMTVMEPPARMYRTPGIVCLPRGIDGAYTVMQCYNFSPPTLVVIITVPFLHSTHITGFKSYSLALV